MPYPTVPPPPGHRGFSFQAEIAKCFCGLPTRTAAFCFCMRCEFLIDNTGLLSTA
jgi:hypothetical protein